MKKCKKCDAEFQPYTTLQKYCSAKCMKENKGYKAIKKVSDKRKALMPDYEKVRIEVLIEAKFKCFIDGCTNTANTIEHIAGRKGFYDDWARDNKIPLVIDKRFLRACCLIHNGELENNPELSRKYQLSKITGKTKLKK